MSMAEKKATEMAIFILLHLIAFGDFAKKMKVVTTLNHLHEIWWLPDSLADPESLRAWLLSVGILCWLIAASTQRGEGKTSQLDILILQMQVP